MPPLSPSPIAVIINPTAGRGRAGRALAHIRARLIGRGRDVSYYLTRTRGEGQTMAEVAINAGSRTIVAVGGDGTLHEVANAILSSGRDDLALGLLPFGTGDDFARGVGLGMTLEEKISAVLDGAPRAVDVGLVESPSLTQPRYFLVAAGVGLAADTAVYVNAYVKAIRGPIAYIYGILRVLKTFKPVEMQVRIDGAERAACASLLSVSNVATTGGGIKIAPGALADDGEFDICLIEAMTKARLLSKLPAAFVGKHIGDPLVSFERASRIEITTKKACDLWIDGEVIGTTPVTITILPGRLPMLLPIPLPQHELKG